nr:ATP-binding protein [uncultured Methanocorpusculum sp.]
MVAANLAFTHSSKGPVTLADCDVEEPNLHLFFPSTVQTRDVTLPIPVIDELLCTKCGKCGEFCRYGAISVLPKKLLFFADLCHSCGGCVLVCPEKAISEEPKRIGNLSVSTPAPGLKLVTGVLDIGSPLAVPIIHEVKKETAADPVVILDTAPGTSCPVVEALEGCDACLLVTESTPFGLHDLELAVDVTKRLGIPAGVVINRSDGKDDETLRFCSEHGIEVLLTIPFSREIASIHSIGDLLCRARPEWQKEFLSLFDKAKILAGVEE